MYPFGRQYSRKKPPLCLSLHISQVCQTNPTTLAHSSADVTSAHLAHADDAQLPFSGMYNVHLTVNRTARQQLQQKYVLDGRKRIKEPFLQLEI